MILVALVGRRCEPAPGRGTRAMQRLAAVPAGIRSGRRLSDRPLLEGGPMMFLLPHEFSAHRPGASPIPLEDSRQDRH